MSVTAIGNTIGKWTFERRFHTFKYKPPAADGQKHGDFNNCRLLKNSAGLKGGLYLPFMKDYSLPVCPFKFHDGDKYLYFLLISILPVSSSHKTY